MGYLFVVGQPYWKFLRYYFVVLVFFLVACETPESENVATSDIRLSITGEVYESNITEFEVVPYNANGGRLRLAAGDRLYARIRGLRYRLQEREWRNEPYPDVSYSYLYTFDGDLSTETVYIIFERSEEADAPDSRIVFDNSPLIYSPTSTDTYSIRTDSTFVEWAPANAGNNYISVYRYYCGGRDSESLNSATNYIFAAKPSATLTCTSGTARIDVRRSHSLGQFDPALNQNGWLTTYIRESVQYGMVE